MAERATSPQWRSIMRATSRRTAERHQDPLTSLQHDITAIKNDLTALVGSRAGFVRDAMKAHLNGVSTEAKHMAGRARNAAGAAHERLGEAARARPLTTIAVSAAAGIIGAKILGLMFSRR